MFMVYSGDDVMRLVLTLLFMSSCASTDYKKAIQDCNKIMIAEGYDFSNYKDVSEFHKGKQEGLFEGYFSGCVDSRTRYK